METRTIVDVHSHFLPEQYVKAMKAAGINDVDGYPLPQWSLESHLQVMDANNIAKCIISISSPGVSFLSGDDAAKLARSMNEEAGTICNKYPDRFGAFALLPLPDVEASLTEIAYALDELKLDGVGFFTNYNGMYPGDKKLDAVFEELNKRKAVVFVHPTAPPQFENINLGFSAPMMEYPFDSTRMVANLLRANTLQRYPNIRMIISHGGGTLPYLGSRIANMLALNAKDKREFSSEIYKEYHSLYFDLTASTHEGALDALKVFMPANHLLMGFDFPFMPAATIPGAIDEIRAYTGFTNEEREVIEKGNGLFRE